MNKSLIVVVIALLISACAKTKIGENNASENYASASELESFCDRLPRPAYAQFDKHPASNDWFEVYEVEPGIFAIYEPFQWQEVISYLIVGTDKAVLFDTGNGIGNIKEITDQLTELSILVINSHSHFDHIGGNYLYEDIRSITTAFSLERSQGIANADVKLEASPQALCKPLPSGVTQENHRTKPYTISRKLKDGSSIDLGGRTLELLHIPGHTDDAVALLDREAGLLWSGDSFYEGPIWLFAPETDLAAYQKTTARLAALAPDLKAVFPAHNTPKSNPDLLIELHENLNLVLAGGKHHDTADGGSVEFKFDNFSLLMRADYNSLP